MCCSHNRAERRERRERRRLATIEVLESLIFRSKLLTSRNQTKSTDADKPLEWRLTSTQPPAYSDVVAQSRNQSSTGSQMAEIERMEKRHNMEKNALMARLSEQESKGL